MKQLQILLIILAAALFFTACQKDETTNVLSISGEVLVQDALTPSITTPLKDITVYLLNSPFTIDTTALWFTKTDLLDSTQTDVNGLYKFSNLQVGNYEVVPIDTVMGYLFEKSASSDNTAISSENEQKDYSVNFSSPEILAENSPNVTFHFNNSGAYANVGIGISINSRKRILLAFWGNWDYNPMGGIPLNKVSASNTYTDQTENSFFTEYSNEYKIQCYYATPTHTFGQVPFPVNIGDAYYIEIDNQKTDYEFDITWNGQATSIKPIN